MADLDSDAGLLQGITEGLGRCYGLGEPVAEQQDDAGPAMWD